MSTKHPDSHKPQLIFSKIFLAILIVLPFSPFLISLIGTIFGENRFMSSWKEVLIYAMFFSLLFIYRNSLLTYLQRSNALKLIVLYLGFLTVDLLVRGPTLTSIAGFAYNSRFIVAFIVAFFLSAYIKTQTIAKKIIITSGVLIIIAYIILLLPNSLLGHIGYDTGGNETINSPQSIYYISDSSRIERLMSTTKSPNSLGLYLLIPFALVLFDSRGIRKNKVHVLVIISAIILTFSRTALIGAVLLGLYWAYLRRERIYQVGTKVSALFYAVGCFLVIGLLTIGAPIVKPVLLHQDPGDTNGSTTARIEEFRNSLSEIADHPFGLGQGTASLAGRIENKDVVTSENYYIQIAKEIGLIGLFIFVTLYSFIMYEVYRSHSKHKSVLVSLLVAFGIGSIFLPVWSEELIAITFWSLLGSAYASSIIITKNARM